MRLIATKRMPLRTILLMVATAALTAALLWASSFTPAAAQPWLTGCRQHDWCDWYQVCRWEYWAWDRGEGWTLIRSDGYC
jgi:hypothetical protein